jgi:hypothetical protein
MQKIYSKNVKSRQQYSRKKISDRHEWISVLTEKTLNETFQAWNVQDFN